MSDFIMEIFKDFVKILVDSIYIGLLAYTVVNACYKLRFDLLTNRVITLEIKQDILHKAIEKVRNIINIDNELCNEQSEQLVEIKKEIQAINKILNKEKDELDLDQESDESIPSPKNKLALPVQNHIIFPHFFVLNNKNFKQKKLSDDTYELRFIGNDLRVISNQLAKFMNVKNGTCMEFQDAYLEVYNYIQENDINDISEDQRLCRLFGITGNEDYEYSDSMIIKVVKKMLEPHFKTITYECVNSK